MSFDIGQAPPKGIMHIRNHSGLEWQFRWGDGTVPFPAGSQLYLLVGPENAPDRWDFEILGARATLIVTVAELTSIADRAPFYLMWKQAAAAEPVALGMGRVRRWKAS
ncbi:LtfC-like domain-containing protein [Nocardia sp. FBN12]|uniref:LtfC-like domain-containing protein n=1 Tax=Nocardia sp. FBN12 TaxID=3419766 RepID=UPI003CFBEBCA